MVLEEAGPCFGRVTSVSVAGADGQVTVVPVTPVDPKVLGSLDEGEEAKLAAGPFDATLNGLGRVVRPNPVPGYNHTVPVLFGEPGSTQVEMRAILDTGASSPCCSAAVVNRLAEETEDTVLQIFSWQTPIPFAGVFAQADCHYGAVINLRFKEDPSSVKLPVMFRVFGNSRSLLISAPLLDYWGWDPFRWKFHHVFDGVETTSISLPPPAYRQRSKPAPGRAEVAPRGGTRRDPN